MGLLDKMFNRNFFVAVIIVLLVATGIGFFFWYKTINELIESQEKNAIIERKHESDKRKIQSDCDSVRTIDALRYEIRQDSMNRVIFSLLKENSK